MFKKIMATILTLCMASALCACNTTKTPSSSKADASSTVGSASSAETQKLTYPVSETKITVKGVVVDMQSMDPRTVWQDVEKVTNVHFEWDNIKKDSLSVYMAASDWPDFFHCKLDSTYVTDYGVTGGRFVDYAQYLDLMPNLQQAFKDFPLAQKIVTENNGAIYQLPYIEESATTCTARMYYREDVLKAAGQSVPKTTDEFYKVLTALKQYNNGAAPLMCGLNEASYCGAFLYSSFGPSTTADFEDNGNGKVVYNRTSDQYRLYLEYCHKLYAEGLLHKEYLTLDGNTAKSLAQSGKTVFMDGSAHGLTEADFASGKVELNVLAPLTSEVDSKQEVIGCAPANTNCGFFMNSKCKYIKELCRTFDIMYATKEVAEGTGLYGESFCYGNEGVNWAFSNSDKTEYKFILPAGVDGSFTTYQYNNIIFTNSGRATALADAVTSTPGNNQARQFGFVKNLIPYQEETPFPASFLKFTEDEQTVLDNNYTEIQTAVSEMHDKFISGVKDITDDNAWNEYCKSLDQMNVQEVVKVYQQAYDRWNKL